MATDPSANPEVAILGGGLAGKAAALHLARAGLAVACIEPVDAVRAPVGESLDWSAPDLLKALGLPMERLVAERVATWKRHVTLRMRDGASEQYVPTEWLGGPPFHIELRTLHVDRFRLDDLLSKLVIAQGVRMVREHIIRVERSRDRVCSVHTAEGSQLSANWFIDASGSASSLLGRELDLPSMHSGPAKVAMWAYFAAPQAVDGTTLYMDPAPSEYLDWIWEIPINPETVSVGYITTGAAMKTQRERGLSVEDIFRQRLLRFPRFQPLLEEKSVELNVTSFRCRAYRRCAGTNWLLAGEAASMVDPITANGVTAALRHAAEAAALILKFRNRRELPRLAQICYTSRILQLAKFFNGGIEKIVYQPAVRNRIGLANSGNVYTAPAWSMNAVYARLKPQGVLSTLLLNSVLASFRLGAWTLYQFCRQAPV